jgi:hypothetical protein
MDCWASPPELCKKSVDNGFRRHDGCPMWPAGMMSSLTRLMHRKPGQDRDFASHRFVNGVQPCRAFIRGFFLLIT